MDWKQLTVKKTHTIRETLDVLNNYPEHLVIVLNESSQLVGTVTDGDIRRGLLKNFDLDSEVSHVMNQSPNFVYETDLEKDLKKESFKKNNIFLIPVLDQQSRIVNIYDLRNAGKECKKRDNLIVLMAGGFGKRLGKITEKIPKPLVEVNGKPMINHIIEGFIDQGFDDFLITLGYKGEMIKLHLGSGENLGCHIRYTFEEKPLGTAGALSLIDFKIEHPFLVMNSDLVVSVDYQKIIEFHIDHAAKATMCVREGKMTIPYGVVDIEENGNISQLYEKPTQKFLVNSGMYILDPTCINEIPKNEYFDMTDLFNKLLEKGEVASAYALHESWIDIGRPEELKRAEDEFGKQKR